MSEWMDGGGRLNTHLVDVVIVVGSDNVAECVGYVFNVERRLKGSERRECFDYLVDVIVVLAELIVALQISVLSLVAASSSCALGSCC